MKGKREKYNKPHIQELEIINQFLIFYISVSQKCPLCKIQGHLFVKILTEMEYIFQKYVLIGV